MVRHAPLHVARAARGDDELDHRIDIYGWLILYEMVTAEVPFADPTTHILSQVLSDEPTPPRERNPE